MPCQRGKRSTTPHVDYLSSGQVRVFDNALAQS